MKLDTTIPNALLPTGGQGLVLDPVGKVPLDALGSGTPSALTFLRGDRTWATLSTSLEIVYTEATANVGSITGTTEGTSTTVLTAGSFTPDGSTTVLVDVFLPGVQNTAAAAIFTVSLFDNGASIGFLSVFVPVTANQSNGPVRMTRKLTPSNAAHVYTVRCFVSSGTGQVNAGAGGAGTLVPAFIRVSKAA